LQIAAVADALGHQVAVLDMNAYRIGLDAFRQEIRADDWDLVGISALSSQYKYVKQLLPIVREEHPDALIVGGGGGFSAQPKEWLQWLPELEVIVVGEGENTFAELLDVVYSKRFDEVRGLAYRDERGKVKLTEPRPFIGMPDSGIFESLDDLPYPAWELAPVEIYLQNSRIPLCPATLDPNIRRLSITHERGCPMNCIPADVEINIDLTHTVEIEDFVYNPSSKEVLGMKGKRLMEAQVLARETFLAEDFVEITTEDGQNLTLTKDNLVKTKRGWIRADELIEGDEVLCI